MQDTVVLISKPGLGTTRPEDSEFAREMLEKYLHVLEAQPPKAVVFYTEGTRMAIKGAGLDLSLGLLRGLGVQVLCCRTCLQYYGFTEDQALGRVVGMDDIVRLMGEAAKVVTF